MKSGKMSRVIIPSMALASTSQFEREVTLKNGKG